MEPSRNDLCPCGSGKKYKRCHGAQGTHSIPAQPDASHLLQSGMQFHQRGDLANAEILYRRILQTDPKNVNALYMLGVAMLQSGKFDLAIPLLEQVSGVRPGNAEVCNNLGVALKELGRCRDAIGQFRQAIAANAQFAEAHGNLGSTLRAEGDLEGALTSYRLALTLKPDHPGFMLNLGHLLHAKGLVAEAEIMLRRVLEIAPQDPAASNSLGKILLDRGDFIQARHHLEIAVSRQPNFSDALLNLGATFLKMRGEARHAITCFQMVLNLDPDCHQAWINLGHAYSSEGRVDDARAAFRRALAIRPDDGLKLRIALMLPEIMGTFEEVAASRALQISEFAELERSALSISRPEIDVGVTNFYLAYQGENDLQSQRQLARICERACPSLLWVAPHCDLPAKRHGLPRIGFVSRQLKTHSVGLAARGLIAGLDRKRFSVTVFSNAEVGDPVSEFIQQTGCEFRDVPDEISLAQRLIASCELDILVYPDIGMDPFTYFLGFSRLAPVQCVMCGHSGTTGIRNMDYFLSHVEVEPIDADQHYGERLARLDTTFFPAMLKPSMPAHVKTRLEFGLPENAHLYACPQSLFKLHPDFDLLIAEILRRDPIGRLVLLEGEKPLWRELLCARFSRTIPKSLEQIVFVPRMSREDFLNLIAVCDVVLDTIHVGGGMTSLDSFAAGTPIVTLPGRLMRGRFTAAWLRRIGVEDCIATDVEHFISLAVRLATDAAFREDVSRRMANNCNLLFEDHDAVKVFEDFFYSVMPLSLGAPGAPA